MGWRWSTAIGPALCASLALAAAPSHAALGGAPSLVTTQRADLRSATLVSGTTVRFCFDKTLDRSVRLAEDAHAGGAFALTGYDPADVRRGASVAYDPADVRCVLVRFGGGSLRTYSVAAIDAGLLRAIVGGPTSFNLTDAAALGGSASAAGTIGHTTAPDLVGAVPDPVARRVYFVFDQDVDPARLATSAFHLLDANGVSSTATALTASGTVVGAFFPGGVGDAAAAWSDESAARSTTAASSPSPLARVGLPRADLSTARPDLITARVSADGTSIDFVYDQPVDRPSAPAFRAYRATSAPIAGVSATVLEGGVIVRVTFADLAAQDELVVHAAATDSAVAGGTPGGAGVGDNAGAFAAGFTAGPDALAAKLDPANGVARLTFDQRVAAVDPARIHLLDGGGKRIGTAAAPNVPARSRPGPITVTLRFDPAALAGAKGIELEGSAAVAFPSLASTAQVLAAG